MQPHRALPRRATSTPRSDAVETLAELAGDRAAELAAVLYRLRDEAAALHLFRVAAGLDSLVPGEGEILGQVRSAFEAGSPGPFLDRLFRQALHVGRRVRLETAIAESPASVPVGGRRARAAGVRRARRPARPAPRRGQDRASRQRATWSRAARRSPSSRTGRWSTARSWPAARRPGARARCDRPAELARADVVVSSTSAPGIVLDARAVAAALRARKGRPLLLVDLAVPRDLDPAINELDGCFLYDVDDLEAVVAETLSGRRSEAARAERLVADEADRFREWQASLDVVPTIASLRALAEEIRDSELARAGGRLSERERHAVESVTSQILAKLLHLPTIRMKEAAAAADGVVYADVVRHLFGLEEEERRR